MPMPEDIRTDQAAAVHRLVCERCCEELKGVSTSQRPLKDLGVSLLRLALKPPTHTYASPNLSKECLTSKRLADLLHATCMYNKNKCFPNSSWWWFENHSAEPQDVQEIIDKILEKLVEPWSTLITAVILLDRVNAVGAPLNRNNIVRLFGACLVVAIKLTKDVDILNSQLTFLFSCPIHVVHILEAQVLRVLEWKTFVSEATFAQYASAITWPLIRCEAPVISSCCNSLTS